MPRMSRKRALLATSILTVSLAVPMTAHAQERLRDNIVETERVLTKVEVTAQRKTQDLQDVPIAIQTFDTAQLDTLRIDGFDDLANFTPGLVASPNPADSTGLRLSIRGIGQDDPQIGLDPTVGLYINGVYIGKTPGLAFDTPDLERVEVLKGPQGTLYGRNAVAGAINIITKGAEIGEGFTGHTTVEFGNFDQFGLRGAVNIPLGDKAAVKLAGLVFDRDGYVENVEGQFDLAAFSGNPLAPSIPVGGGSDFGGIDRTGITVDFAWQPTPEILFEYGFDDSTSIAEPFFNQLVPNADGGFGFLQAGSLAAGVPLVPVVEGFQQEVTSQVPIDESRVDVSGHRASVTWDWHENHSTKILGAFREADSSAFASFFPELNPFVLQGILGAGADPTLPADPLTNPSFIDSFAVLLPAFLEGVDALTPLDLTTRPDFAVPFTTPVDPLFLPGPFATFGTSIEGGNPTLDDHEQFQIELTQTGSLLDGRLEYTGGLFYFDEDTAAGPFISRPGDGLELAQLLPVLNTLGQANGVLATQGPAALLTAPLLVLDGENNPVIGPDGLPVPVLDADGNPVLILQNFVDILSAARGNGARLELDTQAFAAFGEVTFQLTDQLSITGGLRYSRDEKEAFQQGFSPFFGDTTDLLGNPIAPLTGDEVFDSFDPKAVIEWTPSDDLLLYASYSQAFRSGGFNQPSVNLDDFVFDEERIRSVEVGFKSDLFANRVRLNANFFASFVDDQQFTFTNPAVPVQRFVENNDAEFIGFEVDGQFVVSEGLIASFSYAFLETDVDEFINPFTGALAGEIDNAPRNSVAINLDYNRPIGPGELTAHIGFNHKSSTTVIGVPRTDQNLLDARLSYALGEIGGRQVSIFAYGQNLTDDEFTIDGLDVLGALIGTTQTFGLPRTYGGGITVSF